jgi:hypothetical protein
MATDSSTTGLAPNAAYSALNPTVDPNLRRLASALSGPTAF